MKPFESGYVALYMSTKTGVRLIGEVDVSNCLPSDVVAPRARLPVLCFSLCSFPISHTRVSP